MASGPCHLRTPTAENLKDADAVCCIVSSTESSVAEGHCEYLGAPPGLRSGRFKANQSAAIDKLTIGDEVQVQGQYMIHDIDLS